MTAQPLPPVETIKQRVRLRLATLARHPHEADIPFSQRAPLGRFFPLEPFDPELKRVIGPVLGFSEAESLLRHFFYGYEGQLEPSYDDADNWKEVDAKRRELRDDWFQYQEEVRSFLAEQAGSEYSVYQLMERLQAEVMVSNHARDLAILQKCVVALAGPRPSGRPPPSKTFLPRSRRFIAGSTVTIRPDHRER